VNIDNSWDGQDIPALLRLEALGQRRFVSNRFDLNQQQRVFGGQLLGQAASAAAHCVEGRLPTYLHGLFLRGASIAHPIEYQVEQLQQGKRFSSFHVRGTQLDRPVIDVQISFQGEEPGLEHAKHLDRVVPPPEAVLNMEQLGEAHAEILAEQNYKLLQKPTLEIRFVDPDDFLFKPASKPEVVFWIRTRRAMPDDAVQKALATIYLSDYFAGFSVMTSHRAMVGARNDMYVASLNHTIWLHQPVSPDQWLLAVTESPHACSGRGLAVAHFYRPDGTLVASVAQECSVTEKTA
jgi:acyl-CoA thioesterase-2